MAATASSDLQAHAGQGKKRKIQDTDAEEPQIEASDQADQVCLLHPKQLTQCSGAPELTSAADLEGLPGQTLSFCFRRQLMSTTFNKLIL